MEVEERGEVACGSGERGGIMDGRTDRQPDSVEEILRTMIKDYEIPMYRCDVNQQLATSRQQTPPSRTLRAQYT